MKRRVGIYLRVSTDGQTTENQRRELEAVAARSGWEVVDVYEDAGISGANGREKRPGLDRLLKDATARKVTPTADVESVVGWVLDSARECAGQVREMSNNLAQMGLAFQPDRSVAVVDQGGEGPLRGPALPGDLPWWG